MRISTISAMLGIALAVMPAGTKAETFGKERVDLLLVLAVDVSRSVNRERFERQRNGYTEALVNAKVLRAIRSGPFHRIAVTYFEWSGQVDQKVLVEWAIIDGYDSAEHFAEQLGETPRSFKGNTAIGDAIEFALRQLDNAPFAAERMVIDISGDGASNEGTELAAARNVAVDRGVVINGLPILSAVPMPEHPDHTNPPGGLGAYYRNNVAGGFGSFVMIAENFESFGAAIVKKMIAEIAAR